MKTILKGKDLVKVRKILKLSLSNMASLLTVDLKDLKEWEKRGLKVPHDLEGPVSLFYRIILSDEISDDVKVDFLDTWSKN